MAKRFTDTDIWDKEWFMALNLKQKHLIRFIFDKCDVAGIWSPNWVLASTYIGEKVSSTDLKVFKNRIIILEDGKIFVPDFVKFQYGTLSENCKPHLKVIEILKKYNLYEYLIKGYPYPMERVQDKEKDKEEEKEKDKPQSDPAKIFEICKPKIEYTDDQLNAFSEFQAWIEKNTPRVSKFKTPFTIDQYLKIKKTHSSKKIIELLFNMENWNELLKKNRNAFLTFNNWSKRNNGSVQETPLHRISEADKKLKDAANQLTKKINGN